MSNAEAWPAGNDTASLYCAQPPASGVALTALHLFFKGTLKFTAAPQHRVQSCLSAAGFAVSVLLDLAAGDGERALDLEPLLFDFAFLAAGLVRYLF